MEESSHIYVDMFKKLLLDISFTFSLSLFV